MDTENKTTETPAPAVRVEWRKRARIWEIYDAADGNGVTATLTATKYAAHYGLTVADARHVLAEIPADNVINLYHESIEVI